MYLYCFDQLYTSHHCNVGVEKLSSTFQGISGWFINQIDMTGVHSACMHCPK